MPHRGGTWRGWVAALAALSAAMSGGFPAYAGDDYVALVPVKISRESPLGECFDWILRNKKTEDGKSFLSWDACYLVEVDGKPFVPMPDVLVTKGLLSGEVTRQQFEKEKGDPKYVARTLKRFSRDAKNALQENTALLDEVLEPREKPVTLRFLVIFAIKNEYGGTDSGRGLFEIGLNGGATGVLCEAAVLQGDAGERYLWIEMPHPRDALHGARRHRANRAICVAHDEVKAARNKSELLAERVRKFLETCMVPEDPTNEKYRALKREVEKAEILARAGEKEKAGDAVRKALAMDVSGVHWRLVIGQYEALSRAASMAEVTRAGNEPQAHLHKLSALGIAPDASTEMGRDIDAFIRGVREGVEKKKEESVARSVEEGMAQARESLADKDYLSAKRKLSRVLALKPGSTEASLLLVDVGGAIEAMPAAEKARVAGALLEKAKARLEGGAPLEAVEIASDVLVLDPRYEAALEMRRKGRDAVLGKPKVPRAEFNRLRALLGEEREEVHFSRLLLGADAAETGDIFPCVGQVFQHVDGHCIVDAGQGTLWVLEGREASDLTQDKLISGFSVFVGNKSFRRKTGGETVIPVFRMLDIVD